MSTRKRLENIEDLMFRQVHPDHFNEKGKIANTAFRPTKRDDGELSVDWNKLISAEESFFLRTKVQNKKSAGTWAVSVGECLSEDFHVLHDPIPSNLAHALIVFNKPSQRYEKLGKIERRALRVLLAVHAEKRGRLHPPQLVDETSSEEAEV